jgi:hypothetical protein
MKRIRVKYPFIVVLFSLGFLPIFSRAQHQEVAEKPGIWRGKQAVSEDSSSLLHAFKSGHLEGHFRYFFSSTDNAEGLSDYHAQALGGGLRYETGRFHGFQLGISGFYVFNLYSSNLAQRDSVTNQLNRYELGLFDIEDPNNKKDIDRLEELYLKYQYGQSFIRFGRQLINTPFINLQDGRMRPTGVEGLWFEMNEVKKLHLEGSWLYAISPRSTVKWYSTAGSVGVYPSGVNIDGSKSDYKNKLRSKGVFTLGAKYRPNSWLSLSAYDLLFENVQNTVLLQADIKKKLNQERTVIAAGQFIRQDAMAQGGSIQEGPSYINHGHHATTMGARLGMQSRKWELTFNYNRIFAQGRYLMPREWGREPFFTFLPRERNEGLGNTHAYMAKFNYHFPKSGLKTSLAAGYYQLPDVKNYLLNKYGMPSYFQMNADIRYAFQGILKGLDAQFLLVGKLNNGHLYGERKFEINKVNMILYNLVLNYHF